MCGIGGFTGFKDEKLIKQMSADMKHRGPDGDGFYIDGTISLMNRRLAIIDRKGGDQPIYNEDKSVVVVYNGEIYNYLELRRELETLGHVFKTKSDTECIVHGYEQWGEMCFDKFNGMFAAAVYDIKKKRLVLARDHFGIKPIYFAKINSSDKSTLRLIFSSEIKPILNSGLIEKKVNERILYRYLKFRIHDEDRETFFDGIYRLLPGEVLVLENKKLEIKEFSSLKNDLKKSIEVQNNQPWNDHAITKFRKLLTEAIQSRLMSEVPVGTALSGGLDSSTVVAIINKLLNEHVSEAESVGTKQNTFSAVFPGSSNDEEKYVDAVLKKSEKISSHKIFPKPEEFFTDLEDFIKTQEEPTISTGPYAQYKVMQEAAKHVTVLLDGQGADEMMAGYLPYYFVYLNQLKKERKFAPLLAEVWSARDVLVKYFTFKFLNAISVKKHIEITTLLAGAFNKKYPDETFKITSDNLKHRLFEDIFSNSLPSLLRYEDRNTMRFSLEGRVPFLDFNLLRYLFSLPDEAIIKDGWNKNILRKSVGELLPPIIVNRRNKIGFTTPENEWFLRMKNRIYGIFMSESFVNRPYFNQPEVIKAFQLFIEGKTDDTLLFWRLMNVELWLREFFDEKVQKSGKNEWNLGDANEGKNIEIQLGEEKYFRFPVKTELVKKGDDIKQFITENVKKALKVIDNKKKWYVIISEKIVAISQGRSFFIWDINPTWWASTLSKFVTRTPYGIGLGSPWTLQIAIDEIGLPRVLFAAVASVITKPFGMKGMFYKIVGKEIAAIDGPTEYSVYPSNVSAKLAPRDPQMAAEHIRIEIMKQIKDDNFAGVVIIDANDLGRNVLGNATEMPGEFFENAMKDNPMGQGSEQTPIVLLQ